MPRDSHAPGLALDGVSHVYGPSIALDGVTLEIERGTATAVIGPDGVGKSTLLALLAGVKRLQTGRISVFGGDMRSSAYRHGLSPRIAYMPQGLGRNLYPTLTVAENIDFFARLFGQAASERRERIDRLLRATGLEEFPDRPAGKLSGGMKQKLALCCALIHDPEFLILDEPTTGVDPLSRRQFWLLIDEIRAARPGMTVLVATAYMEEAARFEQLVAISAGRILAAGRTSEVVARTGASSLEDAYRALQGQHGENRAEAVFITPPRLAAGGNPAVVAKGLTKRFGDFTAVDNVSFRIERGEIFGFLGSNGSGKTTMMKMLTGLLAASEGAAELLGEPIEAGTIETRRRVGYMSQTFSLYEELTVRGNLQLHARLYAVPPAQLARAIDKALSRFDLAAVAGARPDALPLGIRQRLQLAAACIHGPELLILDEPTCGVDPEARNLFWRLLGKLSREDGVTVFISTHFMNEAERCDRISLMHGGKVLAIGSPRAICAERRATTLEEAFVSVLTEATGGTASSGTAALAVPTAAATPRPPRGGLAASFARIWIFAWREATEILRDPVRLAFALLSPLLLMMTFGYGVSFDVENLPFVVLDRDRTAESRRLVESFSGSRYFRERPPLASEAEMDRRLRAGELRLAIEVPSGFGEHLLRGWRPEVAFIIDGAMPFRAETTRGYVHGIVAVYVRDLARRPATDPAARDVRVERRFRYNQEFRSAAAITPGCIMILLIIIPSMLTALGVVREREIGSIANLYASPASIGEFLLGKQMPYAALGFVSFLGLAALVALLFDVPIKGSVGALALAAALYVFAATSLGLVVSAFARTQVAAIIGSAIICTVPAINFSGYLYPAATLEGAGRFIGLGFPSLWFQNVSLGAFTKGYGFSAFFPEYLALFGFGAAFLVLASLLLRKQER